MIDHTEARVIAGVVMHAHPEGSDAHRLAAAYLDLRKKAQRVVETYDDNRGDAVRTPEELWSRYLALGGRNGVPRTVSTDEIDALAALVREEVERERTAIVREALDRERTFSCEDARHDDFFSGRRAEAADLARWIQGRARRGKEPTP